MSDLIEKAKALAYMAHIDQKRKYTNEPYFVHLEEVANKLKEHGFPDEVR